jgi:hypothetical protein
MVLKEERSRYFPKIPYFPRCPGGVVAAMAVRPLPRAQEWGCPERIGSFRRASALEKFGLTQAAFGLFDSPTVVTGFENARSVKAGSGMAESVRAGPAHFVEPHGSARVLVVVSHPCW